MSPASTSAAGLALLASLALAACRAPDRVLTAALAVLPDELPAYRDVVADFERESGWRVVVVPQQYADIRRALAAEAAAAAGALDLVELDVYSLAPAADDVAVLDETALADELAALSPAALAAGRIEGLRFLPHRLSWQAMVYDHDVLGAPPRTWAELEAVARAHPGGVAVKGARYEGLTCDVLPFVWAAGGSGEEFDDPGARRAFALFARLAPYLNRQSAVFREATIAEAMARGEIVLHLNWPFAMSLLASQGLAPQRIRSAPLPRGPEGSATVLGGGYLAIPRSAARRPAALALLRFLVSAPAQRRLGARLGWFSPRRDVPLEDPAGVLAGYAAMRADVRPRPELARYPQLSRLWQEAFRAVAFDGVAPDAALARAAARWPPPAGPR